MPGEAGGEALRAGAQVQPGTQAQPGVPVSEASPSGDGVPADGLALQLRGVGKCYYIYDKPQDRLKQAIVPRIHRLIAPLARRVDPRLVTFRPYFREFWALRDISLEVEPGESVGLIGPNGAGKSTLLQLICRTLTPTRGEVRVSGKVAALLELGSGFNPEFTGRENVFTNAAILGLSREETEARFDEIAAFADIGDFLDQPVKTYSSGMYVRLAFAVAASVDPDILIVDEALAVGDMGFQFKCNQRINQLIDSGVTLLFAAHDIGMVKALCSKALYLSGGQVRAAGAADRVIELYFMDIREQQTEAIAPSSPVKLKSHVVGPGGLAFGTDQGWILSAVFPETGGQQALFTFGDRIRIQVEAKFSAALRSPALSIVVNDRRMIPVIGRRFRLASEDPGGAEHRTVSVELSFRSRLAEGPYLVTLRLEDHVSAQQLVVVDKQVEALSFEMLRNPSQEVLGLVDEEIELTELAGD